VVHLARADAPRARMTPLAERLAARIALSGPMDLAAYMEACLLDPQHGYYATRDPFGAGGDFTTAPEISQMFGELLGLALGQAWLDQGRPANAILAEVGPGRGTLMTDATRALARGLGWRPPVALVEASPHLRAVQRERLGAVTHLDSVENLPDSPLFLIANEFFDALPIRQFQMTPEGWRERQVGVEEGALHLALGPPLPLPWPGHPGEVREDRPTAPPIMAAIAGRIARHGGVAIIIDYGTWNGTGDSLQALRRHQPEEILAHPGEADLTAHVDFAPLAAAARGTGAQVSALQTQGALLMALGIDTRAAALSRAAPGRAADVEAARHRLTHPSEMGDLFKALAVWPQGAPPPPGFAPPTP